MERATVRLAHSPRLILQDIGESENLDMTEFHSDKLNLTEPSSDVQEEGLSEKRSLESNKIAELSSTPKLSGDLISKRKSELEKRLVKLTTPPKGWLRRTAWRLSVSIAERRIESSIRREQQEISLETNDVLKSENILKTISIIAESIVRQLVRRIVYPILTSLILSSEQRHRLSEFSERYKQLLELQRTSQENDLEKHEKQP